MAVKRRIGNLTIHFLGENAAQLSMLFDNAHYWSKTFRRDMDETSRTHRDIYVGSALSDLQDQPNFGNAGFNPESDEVREKPAFGKAAGAETHFIVVKPATNSLVHDGRRFDGSAQLALVHELLHPSQTIRELAEKGELGQDNERQTQMREQRIAVELRKVPGKDFPDVIGSGATYDVPPHENLRPTSVPPSETELVAPIVYDGPVHVQPPLSSWRDARGSFKFPRYSASASAARMPNGKLPALLSDAADELDTADRKPLRYLGSRIAREVDHRQTALDDRFGGGIAPASPVWLHNRFEPETPQQAAPLVGLVSGEPMDRRLPSSIFGLPETRAPRDEDWLLRFLAPRGLR